MSKSKITFKKISFNSLNARKREDEVTSDDGNVDSGLNSGFGVFGKVGDTSQPDLLPEVKDSLEIIDSLGFGEFGKKARSFSIEEMMKRTKDTIEELDKEKLEKLRIESSESIENEVPEHFPNPKEPSQSSREEHNEGKPESDSDEDFIGPPVPHDAAESDSSEDEDDKKLPISHELVLTHGSKPVSALAVDHSGCRMTSGSVDYSAKCWDFQGMDATRQSFRTFCPADGYPIRNIDYSSTGDKILVVSGSSQAKVYDRDGKELYECAKGDMYIHDMAKTKGHVAGLTCGMWHPKDREEFLTSSLDGTCRLWYSRNTNYHSGVMKPRSANGLKTNPTACCYSRDGMYIACACEDGSIQMWDHRKNFVNTCVCIRKAHKQGTCTSSITFSYDNKAFCTRGGDDTLKLWDIRKYKQPVHSPENLFNRFDFTDCLFSPNDQLVITGTSVNKGEVAGKLLMFNRDTFQLEREMVVGESHVLRVLWHPRLNQFMIGSGDGNVYLLYDVTNSRNGAVLVAGKRSKRAKQSEVVVSKQIITPHALPLFREERHKSSRKLEEKHRKDPVKSHQPEMPLGKTGSGGRVAAGGSTLSSYIIRNMGIRNKAMDEGDPREALLKYAKVAEEDPYWVTPAYSKTQPKAIFDVPQEEEQPAAKKQKTLNGT